MRLALNFTYKDYIKFKELIFLPSLSQKWIVPITLLIGNYKLKLRIHVGFW